MKTLMLFITDELEHNFFELDGDYRHLNNIFINTGDWKNESKLDDLLFEKESCSYRFEPKKEPTKDWDFFIVCGYLV